MHAETMDPLAELRRACDYDPDGEASMDALVAYKDALEDRVREQPPALSADARAVVASLVADESEHDIDADPAAPAVWEEIRAAFPFTLYAAREGEAR